MLKRVDSVEEFNALEPKLREFIDHSYPEWEFYEHKEDLFLRIKSQSHLLYYAPSLTDVRMMCLLQVEYYATGNSLVSMAWSSSPTREHFPDETIAAATELAKLYGAKRLKCRACRGFGKELMQRDFTPNHIELIKDI